MQDGNNDPFYNMDELLDLLDLSPNEVQNNSRQ